ncbi:glycosyltransferase family 34 protein [Suhomyces tanzawaensis NRRL Y-17324]|uniref:Glycosyltransferase family 34 protein n=1 Tax=Suhomyces tanzawaensis NRRL Y-17324 TaxID=984487 RepID=A0A1E4SD31_9ASCO|nr:glycosyltransferase family 34 protein [Suhomyces tanzawaensis NRRL Y-17324]ODV77420.1 glycosyltransferase family 34 protein [Suhomyces tanzawaensis NRRL Y-17324]
MFSSNSGNNFRPRYGKGKGFLPLPATFNRIQQKQNITYTIIGVILLWFFFNPFSLLGGLFRSHHPPQYPAGHPFTSNRVIEHSSPYIFPRIEDTQLLKELTVHKLIKEFKVRDANFPEIEKNLIRSLNTLDDPDPVLQKEKEDDENKRSELLLAKNSFKNQDKVVFRPKNNRNYPEVIIVTAVDFEKYSQLALTKIVQNRVDYAHEHSYGVYVRWYQEFLPALNSLSYLESKEKSKWVRLFCMRAAMFAFPHAKWFWYFDQDGLVMDLNVDIQQYMLNAESLNPIMQREQAIIPPDGAIKTYKNTKAESVKLIFTQSESKIETHSFIIKNDHVGKSIMEFWCDNLYLTYPNFPFGPDSALTHILQWHPFILSKASIVPPKTIASQHAGVVKQEKPEVYNYKDGDFVVQWADCVLGVECEKFLETYTKKSS